jgi:hypothetical protein
MAINILLAMRVSVMGGVVSAGDGFGAWEGLDVFQVVQSFEAHIKTMRPPYGTQRRYRQCRRFPRAGLSLYAMALAHGRGWLVF